MRRPGLIAALAVLLSLPAWPQMRGTHVGAVRPAGATRGPAMPARVNGRLGGVVGHGFTHGGFVRPGAFPFHHHHHFFGLGFSFPWAFAYYPGWYWDYPLDYSDYESYSQDQQLQAYQMQQMNNQQQIEQRLDALEERLDRLYEQRSAPAPETQSPPQRQSKTETSAPAVLVYKDGHRQEVQNYAVVGQTIWILNEQQAKKVPLSVLDLNATRKANQDRDVDLPLPPENS